MKTLKELKELSQRDSVDFSSSSETPYQDQQAYLQRLQCLDTLSSHDWISFKMMEVKHLRRKRFAQANLQKAPQFGCILLVWAYNGLPEV